MKLHRVLALVNRHLMLYKCSPQRIMEIIYWPLLDSPDLGLPHHLAAGKPDGLLLFWPEGRPAVERGRATTPFGAHLGGHEHQIGGVFGEQVPRIRA